jgi:hypothetical protein
MMMRSAILLLFTLILTTATVFASESAFEKAFARGMAELEGANYDGATAEFRNALAERPDDLDAHLYLGIALSRSNSPEAEAHLKSALALEPGTPLTNLELGVYYYNKAMYDEAGDYFENLITITPGSEYSTTAQEYLRRIRQKTETKPWGIRFLAGMQYDSNVVLNADGTPLPSGVSRRSDWRGIINAGLDYKLVSGSKGALEASYSLYQSLHTRLSDFDITQNIVGLTGTYRLGAVATVRLGYGFEYLYLGGDAYDTAHTVAPALVFATSGGYNTSFEYRYRNTDFRNSAAFPANDDRSGGYHQAGATQRIPLGESMTGRIGFYHDEERTRSHTWNASGDRWQAGLTALLPLGFVFDVSGEYYRRTYPEFTQPLTVTDTPVRDDSAYSGSVSATKIFADNYGLTLSYYYTHNISDVAAYEYVRHITSLMFSARY